MTLEELKKAIASLNIPYAYGYFDGKQHPKYIVYYESLRNVIHADGVVVYGESWITLHLISKKRDVLTEQRIIKLLNDNGIAFDNPEYEYDEEQALHIATFYFQIGG